ncbi:MAG: HAMP domain-containing histidine kinase [bacterium]|nr:HAMP domain-containing histidine kinase [bacterium]
MRQHLSILATLEEAGGTSVQEDGPMSRESRKRRSKSQSRPRRGRHRRHDPDAYDLSPDRYELLDEESRLPSEDERAGQDVRHNAEDRAELLLDAGKMGFIVLLLLAFLTPVGVIALIFWCAKFGRRLFRVMVEPRLRERLIDQQVSRHIHANVSRERQEIAGDHAQSLEVLSASIAHEIRNPITAAKSLLQQMREDPESLENEEYAQVALGELERVERSISHLLRFGRDEEFRKAIVSMRDVLDSALEAFRDRSARESVAIVREFDCDGTLLGDGEKLRRVMINLVGNAFDALQDARPDEPTIEISMGENLASNEVWVKIRDNGHGIDSETRGQIFTPFYTAKPSGTGLGLAITKKLVDAHGGTIEVANAPGGGAEFVLSFPKQAQNGNGASRGGTS